MTCPYTHCSWKKKRYLVAKASSEAWRLQCRFAYMGVLKKKGLLHTCFYLCHVSCISSFICGFFVICSFCLSCVCLSCLCCFFLSCGLLVLFSFLVHFLCIFSGGSFFVNFSALPFFFYVVSVFLFSFWGGARGSPQADHVLKPAL